MATITLRQGHATPSTIILYPLPVTPVSEGTTIRLYAGHATPSTIILGDPTQPRGEILRQLDVAGGAGAFTVTGYDAGLARAIALAGEAGEFVLTGADAGGEYLPLPSGGWHGVGGDDEPWWASLPSKPLPKKVERAIEVAAKVDPVESPVILVKKLERAGIEWQPDYTALLAAMQDREAESMADLRGQVAAAILAARRGEEQVVGRRRKKVLDAMRDEENDELLLLLYS